MNTGGTNRNTNREADADRFKTYLISYHHEGAQWNLELPARSYDEDARARLKKLPLAQIDGELVMSVPASLGFLARVAAAFRNALCRCL